MHAKSVTSKGCDAMMRDESFESYLARARAEMATKRAAIGDLSGGGILKHLNTERWVFVLPDMTDAGKWRIQYFDARGFSGHGTYNSVDDCASMALASGFVERDDTALDRVQRLASFWRGNYAADLIQRINCGELSHSQGDALMAAYDTQQTGAAAAN